ncbi:hypothetical protein ACJX0J_014088, partial [Zea mays]
MQAVAFLISVHIIFGHIQGTNIISGHSHHFWQAAFSRIFHASGFWDIKHRQELLMQAVAFLISVHIIFGHIQGTNIISGHSHHFWQAAFSRIFHASGFWDIKHRQELVS